MQSPKTPSHGNQNRPISSSKGKTQILLEAFRVSTVEKEELDNALSQTDWVADDTPNRRVTFSPQVATVKIFNKYMPTKKCWQTTSTPDDNKGPRNIDRNGAPPMLNLPISPIQKDPTSPIQEKPETHKKTAASPQLPSEEPVPDSYFTSWFYSLAALALALITAACAHVFGIYSLPGIQQVASALKSIELAGRSALGSLAPSTQSSASLLPQLKFLAR